MSEPTLPETLITLINSQANNNPAPQRVTLKKVYNDQKHADITFKNGANLKYIECIGSNITENSVGVLIYLNGETNNLIVIT